MIEIVAYRVRDQLASLADAPKEPYRVQNQIESIHAPESSCKIPAHACLECRFVAVVGKRKHANHSRAARRCIAVVGGNTVYVVVAHSDVVERAGLGRTTGAKLLQFLLPCVPYSCLAMA